MQELIDHQLQHSGFVVITPQANYMPVLTTTTETSSSPNNSWINVSPNVCSVHSSYDRQYMADTNHYGYANHMTPISPSLQPKTSFGYNYFQSETESLSNQSETQSITPTLQLNNKTLIKKKKGSKTTYKHIPHREKPIHLVARRNARERRRVQAVNSAFTRLRKSVPIENRNKRLSKVKTLHRAIEYISALQDLLREADQQDDTINQLSDQQINTFGKNDLELNTEKKYNKENRIADQKWISIETDFNSINHFSESYMNNNYNNNYRYLKCYP